MVKKNSILGCKSKYVSHLIPLKGQRFEPCTTNANSVHGESTHERANAYRGRSEKIHLLHLLHLLHPHVRLSRTCYARLHIGCATLCVGSATHTRARAHAHLRISHSVESNEWDLNFHSTPRVGLRNFLQKCSYIVK